MIAFFDLRNVGAWRSTTKDDSKRQEPTFGDIDEEWTLENSLLRHARQHRACRQCF